MITLTEHNFFPHIITAEDSQSYSSMGVQALRTKTMVYLVDILLCLIRYGWCFNRPATSVLVFANLDANLVARPSTLSPTCDRMSPASFAWQLAKSINFSIWCPRPALPSVDVGVLALVDCDTLVKVVARISSQYFENSSFNSLIQASLDKYSNNSVQQIGTS